MVDFKQTLGITSSLTKKAKKLSKQLDNQEIISIFI